ncbi:DegV family protein [Cytobacillus spongiae]|jgi:DegV family protein with EDD domain|uniref:DegV family protein n=1 Tax=Cytobacillus spongiae TaxID=2901381 RepID=UPI001F1D5D63|nr:DegV family protein [Cytobacillus spongiae]UII55355.1 DegV family protein [Cytobacillus spongiae]
MSKKIAWVTDSTASFNQTEQQWLKDNHIYVVPLSVRFGDEVYKEGIEISIEEFYEKMRTSEESPNSSQPSLGDFINLYHMLKESYDEAIVIHCSSALSGTYSTSTQAASMVDFPVHSVDSWIGAFPLKFIVQEGVRLYQDGHSPSEVVTALLSLREKCQLLLIPASLEQLRKGGRVSNFGSILGNLLQIKPILGFKEGKVNIIEKVRTMKKAESTILARLAEAYEKGIHERVGIMYAGEQEQAHKLSERIREAYSHLKIEILPLIPVAGVHTGFGTIGLSWIEKDKKKE